MQCDQVIRELAVPSDGRDDQALADHLAGCEHCARWAERAATFDRLWDATRTAEPSTQAWDRVWSSVSARLDKADATVSRAEGKPARVATTARPWRGFAVVGAIGLAQAAAILLALALSWSAPPRKAAETVPPAAETLAESVVDVPEGQNVYIRSEGSEIKLIDVTALEPANGEDPWFNFLNLSEGKADATIVATR